MVVDAVSVKSIRLNSRRLAKLRCHAKALKSIGCLNCLFQQDRDSIQPTGVSRVEPPDLEVRRVARHGHTECQ